MWWLAMALSSALGVSLGMWGCRYRELQPVFFGGGRILGNNPTPAAARRKSGVEDDDHGHDRDRDHEGGEEGEGGVTGAEDEEMGFVRGGRGRGRERREEYEMVKMEAGK